jgi:hypothetical protein
MEPKTINSESSATYPESFCQTEDTDDLLSVDKDNFELVSRMDFEVGSLSDLMSLWKYSWRAGRDHAFHIVADPIGVTDSQSPNPTINHVARFEVREGDYAGDFDRVPNEHGILTSRSEITERFKAKMSETYWYSFRTFIPEDFPIEDNRLVIAQWHASDEDGEATSPPLTVYYRDGDLLIRARHSDKDKILKDDDTIKVNLYRQENFSRGQWHDFIFQVKWSYETDGMVNMWIDGKQVVEYQGGVGYKDEQGPYFKFGAYRDEEYMVENAQGHKTKVRATDPYVIYHDDYRRGKSCRDIME